jgi:hypothetical protein
MNSTSYGPDTMDITVFLEDEEGGPDIRVMFSVNYVCYPPERDIGLGPRVELDSIDFVESSCPISDEMKAVAEKIAVAKFLDGV